MCHILIAHDSNQMICVLKSDSHQEVVDKAKQLRKKNLEFDVKKQEIIAKHKSKTAEEIGITNAEQYYKYCTEKSAEMMRELSVFTEEHCPQYYGADLSIF